MGNPVTSYCSSSPAEAPAAATDKTIIIPGHGQPVTNRAELKEFRDMLVAIHDNVARSKSRGARETKSHAFIDQLREEAGIDHEVTPLGVKS
jgi:hypothetical protein